LRLTPFIFLTNGSGVPGNSVFSGTFWISARKNRFFSPSANQRLLGIDCCALFSETASFEYVT
jgi:hypothetical protein